MAQRLKKKLILGKMSAIRHQKLEKNVIIILKKVHICHLPHPQSRTPNIFVYRLYNK